VKEINDCIHKGKALYSKCIHYFIFVQDIVNIVKKEEEILSKMVVDYQNLGHSIIDFDKVVSTTMDKIRVLKAEKSRFLNRFSELRSLLTPKISILEKTNEDIEELRKFNFRPAPIVLQHAHIISYASYRLI
jgi:hypothetical protein